MPMGLAGRGWTWTLNLVAESGRGNRRRRQVSFWGSELPPAESQGIDKFAEILSGSDPSRSLSSHDPFAGIRRTLCPKS
jgi:hypothetical protein